MTKLETSYKTMALKLKNNKPLNRAIDIIDTPIEIAKDKANKLDPIDTPIEAMEQEHENSLRPNK